MTIVANLYKTSINNRKIIKINKKTITDIYKFNI